MIVRNFGSFRRFPFRHLDDFQRRKHLIASRTNFYSLDIPPIRFYFCIKNIQIMGKKMSKMEESGHYAPSDPAAGGMGSAPANKPIPSSTGKPKGPVLGSVPIGNSSSTPQTAPAPKKVIGEIELGGHSNRTPPPLPISAAAPKASSDLPSPPLLPIKEEGDATNVTDFSDYKLNPKLTIDDFELLKVLGKGSFGKVMLVRKKNEKDNTLYAMKTLRKAALVKRNQLAHTSTERFILQNIHNPFLVHLVYAFQTPDKLYMVLDYMGGGELFFWLKKDRKFSENRCKLYAAEMVLALDALHSADIVYRDLKPENILLDLDGHIRFTDFGLAKGGVKGAGAEGGTKTFCGTPEYLAPEILENKGHGKAVDWWALGTLLYEMLYGLPPFYDTNVQRMYGKIMNDPLRFSKSSDSNVSEAAKDFLKNVLKRPVMERLGSGPTGAAELKQAPFLASLDFARVLAKQYKPEFKPPFSGKDTDVRNFDTEFTKEKAADSLVVSHMTGTMQEQSKFGGFTFVGDNKL